MVDLTRKEQRKRLLFLLTITALSISIIFASFMGIKTYFPTWLGYPPNQLDSAIVKDTIMLEDTYEITAEKLYELEKQKKLKEAEIRKADSLNNVIKQLYLKDSQRLSTIAMYRDTILPSLDEQLLNSRTLNYQLFDSLIDLSSELQYKQNEVEIGLQRLKDNEKIYLEGLDSLEMENLKTWAKIYNSTNPGEVARILSKMDEYEAATILKLMSKKKAGKVIEQLDPQRSAMILLLANTR